MGYDDLAVVDPNAEGKDGEAAKLQEVRLIDWFFNLFRMLFGKVLTMRVRVVNHRSARLLSSRTGTTWARTSRAW